MLNQVSIVGNLAQEPNTREVETQNGNRTVCEITVALNRPWEDEGENTDFVDVQAWGGTAEYLDTLAVGDTVAVNGRLQTGNFEDNEGITRYFTRVQANRVQGVNRRNSGNGGGDSSGGNQTRVAEDEMISEEDVNEVPF